MELSSNLNAIKNFLIEHSIQINENYLRDKVLSHQDYPSILVYYDLIKELDNNCHSLIVSEENILNLSFPLLGLLRNEEEGSILSYINKIKGGFLCVIKNQEIELNIYELQELWLGIIISINNNNIISEEKLKIDYPRGNVQGLRNIIEVFDDHPNLYIDIIGNDNSVFIDKNSIIPTCMIKIRGNKNIIKIGQNCRINGLYELEDGSSEITIGNDTTIEYVNLKSKEAKKIEIGSNCMLADNISIMTSDSHSILDKRTMKRINHALDIKIKDNVWIARNVTILKGVTIKKGAVIGTGSIVTCNVPENSIAAGNPAKVIKSNISWDRALL